MIDAVKKQGRHSKSGLFSYLALLTAIFCVLEISFFIQCSGFYLADYQMVMSHIRIPLAILPGILFFLFAQFVVHLCFAVIIWGITRLLCRVLRLSWETTQNVGFSLWGFGIVTALLANEIAFPNSKFADLLRLMIPSKAAEVIFYLALFVWCLIALILLWGLAVALFKKPRLSLALGLVITALCVFKITHLAPTIIEDASTAEKPNVILIGVDALRPDFLGFSGSDLKTPELDKFLNHATVFAEAMTPIARTFPAWVSIFTGNYPKESGVRFDLQDQSDLDLTETLPAILRHQGYETLYAMDETRFSNVGPNFGFDRFVTPPVGVNDFFLGTFNDFPLSNLIVNTRLGAWLFPYSYANRPAFVSYDPNSFLKMMQPALEKKRHKPLFLAVHFCLPHFPYFWKNYSYLETNKALPHYEASIERADRLIGDFLAMLKQDGLLEHSIVVLLSDHGEALELRGDRITNRDRYIAGLHNPSHKIPQFYPASFDFEKVNQSAGHGTDVLAMSQYHSVLAFRLYGMVPNLKAAVPGVVSLMDIKPTVLNLLGIKYPKVSGHSLKDIILGQHVVAMTANQDFFIESDFSPSSIRTVHPETRQVLFEGIRFFEIDPVTTRLTVKKSMADLIVSSKQYADFYGPWILALYPQAKGVMQPILVNLKTGYWTNDLTTPFAKTSPAAHMLAAMREFYGSDIASVISSRDQF